MSLRCQTQLDHYRTYDNHDAVGQKCLERNGHGCFVAAMRSKFGEMGWLGPKDRLELKRRLFVRDRRDVKGFGAAKLLTYLVEMASICNVRGYRALN
jgi:hypothetical protein